MAKTDEVISLVIIVMVVMSIMNIMRKIEEHLLRHHCSIIEKFSTVQEGNIKNEEKQNE